MDASTFQFDVFMPRDARFADAVRRLAIQSAQYAGSAAGDVDPFAASVEAAFTGCLTAGGGDVPLVFRRADGPLEVVVDGRVLSLAV